MSSASERICTDLGYCVLKSQIVEHNLANMLAMARCDPARGSVEVYSTIASCRMKSLEQLKNELYQLGNTTVDYDSLAEFIRMRNLLIHNLMLTTNFQNEFANNSELLTEIKEEFRVFADASEVWNRIDLLNFGLRAGLSPEESLEKLGHSSPLPPEEQGNDDLRVQLRGHMMRLRENRAKKQANKLQHPTA